MKHFAALRLFPLVLACLFSCAEEDGWEPLPSEPAIDSVVKYEFTDSRDGQVYEYVKIGLLHWMARNLDYDTASGVGSWCYYEMNSFCAQYGRLYDWNTALVVCPAGWHLPSKTEWQILMDAVGGMGVAGRKLRAQTGWDDGGNGIDLYGFSALPGGQRHYPDELFRAQGRFGYWWSTTEFDVGGGAYALGIATRVENAHNDGNYKETAFSVRCVLDYQ
jgi:uncharacterized protein (TIGR02145 family)